MKKEPMNCFAAISFRCQQIDALAQAYLDKLEFMSNDAVLERLFEIAKKMFKDIQSKWQFDEKVLEQIRNR